MTYKLHRRLRTILHAILVFLTKLTLYKHRPETIIVIGSAQTSIAREAIYQVVKEKFPTRRNMEYVEAEFSIPLTVFGNDSYPKTIPAWILAILKTTIQLLTNRPYKHALVLELGGVDDKNLQQWMSVILPEITVIVGEISSSINMPKNTRVVHIKVGNGKEYQKAHISAAKEIGAYYKIRASILDKLGKEMKFPPARIRFLKGKNGSLIIDATYHYFPVHLMSILEIANTYSGPKVLITNDVTDQMIARTLNQSWSINPSELKLSKEHTVVLRGERVRLAYIGKDVLDPLWLHK
jgi:hypothetical protein